jgi:hypothetical protein
MSVNKVCTPVMQEALFLIGLCATHEEKGLLVARIQLFLFLYKLSRYRPEQAHGDPVG